MKKLWSIRSNYDIKGECIRCPCCGGTEFKDTVTATVYEYQPSEIDTHCKTCGDYVNFWAYGSFDPGFKFNDRSWEMFWVRLNYKLRGLSTP